MFDLDAMVLAKRVSCKDDCSNQQRIKRYRQQRHNLGELNRLASYKPRPTVNVEVLAKTTTPPPGTAVVPVKVKQEEEAASEVSSQSTFEAQEEPQVQSRRERIDRDVELANISAVKRMFGDDGVRSIKRLQSGNPDLEWRENEYAKQVVSENLERLAREAQELDAQTMERRRQKDTTLDELIREARHQRISGMRQDVERYEAYRASAPYYDVIRPSMDEYYERVRDNIGELEQLRD